MVRDYDWDLESPIDDPRSVDSAPGPKYDTELQMLYQVMRTPQGVESEFDTERDSERIGEWEEMMELAHYQFSAVPQVVDVDQDHAENLFDTGEFLVYKLLDDFGSFHVGYYNQFESKRDPRSISDLRESYNDAYETLNEHSSDAFNPDGDGFSGEGAFDSDGDAFGGSGAFEADEDFFGGGEGLQPDGDFFSGNDEV